MRQSNQRDTKPQQKNLQLYMAGHIGNAIVHL
jgi:hypothetical protein